MAQHYDLLAGCKKREAKAQRILYELYKAKLMGICRRYTRSREEAQDVLQEAFIKIFSKIDHLEFAEKLGSWMTAIVVRTAIDHYHKTKTREELFDRMDIPALEYNAGTADIDNFTDDHLVTMIKALPEGCQLAFNLFVVEGYSHAEIAEMLRITEGTSRSQVHYAKNLLREKLTDQNRIPYYEKYS